METEKIAVLCLNNVFLSFITKNGAHFREMSTCLEGGRKGLNFGFGDIGMPYASK